MQVCRYKRPFLLPHRMDILQTNIREIRISRKKRSRQRSRYAFPVSDGAPFVSRQLNNFLKIVVRIQHKYYSTSFRNNKSENFFRWNFFFYLSSRRSLSIRINSPYIFGVAMGRCKGWFYMGGFGCSGPQYVSFFSLHCNQLMFC